MKFDRDIFISYTHVDNRAFVEGQDGWISTFHRVLEIRLEQLRGTPINIWRDATRLQGNDALDESIFMQFPNLALLVAVLSPSYLRSEWCSRELDCFLRAAEARGGITIGGTTRIFKVVKTYLELEEHPPGLRDLLGYSFFEINAAGRPQEFNTVYGPEVEPKFWAKLEDLAYDIHKTLKKLEELPEPGDAPSAQCPNPAASDPASKIIYLAETTLDRSEDRERLRRELEQAGHRVVPDQPLPNPPDFEPSVYADLVKADLSIHLLSPYAIPGDAAQPPTKEQIHQHQMALKRTRNQIELARRRNQTPPKFDHILWLPPDFVELAKRRDQTPPDWVLALQDDPDFIRTNLESLKDIIRDRLQPPPAPDPPLDGTVQVYLDCDQRDWESGELDPLTEWLERNFVVKLPDFTSGGLLQSEALLKQCEAVLIYYGHASSSWLDRRLKALQKNANYNRQRPLRAKAVYVAGPANPTKQNLKIDSWPVQVIKGFKEFDPNLLNPFLEQLA